MGPGGWLGLVDGLVGCVDPHLKKCISEFFSKIVEMEFLVFRGTFGTFWLRLEARKEKDSCRILQHACFLEFWI